MELGDSQAINADEVQLEVKQVQGASSDDFFQLKRRWGRGI